MKQFRSGGYNTLVSTCVGEEGLDIGEVEKKGKKKNNPQDPKEEVKTHE